MSIYIAGPCMTHGHYVIFGEPSAPLHCETEADAAEIARRWNAEPALRDALAAIRDAVDIDFARVTMPPNLLAALLQARAALGSAPGRA